MIDMNAVREELREWLENPYWAAYYNDAPSEECRKYIALELYASVTEDEEAWAEMDRMEPGLSLEDWKHLLKYSGNNPERAKILRRIEALEAEGGKRNSGARQTSALLDESPMYPVHWHRGARGTQMALDLGAITEEEIEDDRPGRKQGL